jgi:hypothetical protein
MKLSKFFISCKVAFGSIDEDLLLKIAKNLYVNVNLLIFVKNYSIYHICDLFCKMLEDA